MTRSSSSAIAAQNSAASPGRPRRCGSASKWQTSVTASDGTTRRDQFSRRNREPFVPAA
jgi:hypothetical protein